MRRLFILGLITLLIVPVLGAFDGHYWKKLKSEKDESIYGLGLIAKLHYLNGMLDGLGWLSDKTDDLVQTLLNTALSNKENTRIYIDMLDDFYSDYANLDIQIIDALTFCLLRLKGIQDDDTAKEELRILRKIYGDTETILSLREKIIQDEEWYECIRVIDGDTIVVKQLEHEPYRLIGEEIKVRLIGVDCHELEEPDGDIAHSLAKIYTEGKMVLLSCGKTRKDVYGRTLAYVKVAGDGWLNEMLIEGGLCRVLSKHLFAYIARYKRLEAMAKLKKHGVWAEK